MKRPIEIRYWTRNCRDSLCHFQLFLPLKFILVLFKLFLRKGSGADLFGGGLTSLVALPLRALTFRVVVCADRLRDPPWGSLNVASIIGGPSTGGCRCRTTSAASSALRTVLRFSSRERVRLSPNEFERFDGRAVPGRKERVEESFESLDVLEEDNAFEALAVDPWGLCGWPLPSNTLFKDGGSEFRLSGITFDDLDALERDDELLALSGRIGAVGARGVVLEGPDDTKEWLDDVGCETVVKAVRAWSTGDPVLPGDQARWAGEDLAVASFSSRYSCQK